ncbi:tRNA pseudouridine synthase [Niveomyces insectorum RCEF 264]|uniref:tRNA pseudouridine synthase 1 n=1 Tax=Niveomyces insectorum RCEF 264 TaxID=1081102 RepID=A0A167P2V6_9HYPO|nr:tRNA pseudouridine synthase [Niveomyces insectorum RCEF 264]
MATDDSNSALASTANNTAGVPTAAAPAGALPATTTTATAIADATSRSTDAEHGERGADEYAKRRRQQGSETVSNPDAGHNKRQRVAGEDRRGSGRRGGRGAKGAGDRRDWRDNRPTKRRRAGGGRNAEADGEGRPIHRRDGAGADVVASADAAGDAGDAADNRPSRMCIPFSAEEIAAETRRPKRKVAVLIGYAGTGYRGMQINHDEKTIEGDLFAAFVAAGAIAKANADDPKKSSLVRCARTDKGVHAAGNVVSLKLIVGDEEVAATADNNPGKTSTATETADSADTYVSPTVVERINAHLPPQIRVWGIQRTVNSFSCYQACDSRWYEYLLPSYALLPPHPASFLGRTMETTARQADEAAAAGTKEGDEPARVESVYEGMRTRLADVADFWAAVERDVVAPILDALEPDVRASVVAQLHSTEEGRSVGRRNLEELELPQVVKATPEAGARGGSEPTGTEDTGTVATEAEAQQQVEVAKGVVGGATETGGAANGAATSNAAVPTETAVDAAGTATNPAPATGHKAAVEQALRDIKAAYVAAKRRYRVTPARRQRLQDALAQFVGTHNFHNYTVQKTYRDASAQRHIKSFVIDPEPILIHGTTEWLSLRVHGQSFMMHQIRKMVAMAVLVARCGTDPVATLAQSFGPRRISIPRAPGFALLLERPVFDSYNARAQAQFQKAPLDFGRYEKELRAFKDREIYARMWDVEESQNVFHAFFHQLDNFRTSYYLWAIPGGFDTAFERIGRDEGGIVGLIDNDPDEDAENPDEGDG